MLCVNLTHGFTAVKVRSARQRKLIGAAHVRELEQLAIGIIKIHPGRWYIKKLDRLRP